MHASLGRLKLLGFTAILPLATACFVNPPPVNLDPVPATIGQTFSLRIGQTATFEAEKLTVVLNDVVSDTRCPTNVNCAVSGELIVEVQVTQDGTDLGTLTLDHIYAYANKNKQNAGEFNVAVLKATPGRIYENFGKPNGYIRTPNKNEYLVDLVVNRPPSAAAPVTPAAPADQKQRVPFGQSVAFNSGDITLSFESVVSDNRCPKSPYIACSTSGKATIGVKAVRGGDTTNAELSIPRLVEDTTALKEQPASIPTTADVLGYRFQLVSLDPMPAGEAFVKPAPDAYVATLLVLKS